MEIFFIHVKHKICFEAEIMGFQNLCPGKEKTMAYNPRQTQQAESECVCYILKNHT